MDDIKKQIEELEVLSSIYGNDWKMNSRGDKEHSIDITHGNATVTLCFSLPDNYPSSAPPVCEMSAPALNKIEKDKIFDALNDIYINNLGEIILYQCIEKVREMLELLVPDPNALDEHVFGINLECVSKLDSDVKINYCPNITHGDKIEDRKSVFQAHVATLTTEEDVNAVLDNLKKERKIAEATHNILAWRFGLHQDYDDDGEKAAGSRLLHLLELLNINNVVVVVSRWYGGIHLGPARFRHINNAARQALIRAGLVNKQQ